MSRPDPAGHAAGDRFVRATIAVHCGSAALLLIALASAMDRWMIG